MLIGDTMLLLVVEMVVKVRGGGRVSKMLVGALQLWTKENRSQSSLSMRETNKLILGMSFSQDHNHVISLNFSTQ